MTILHRSLSFLLYIFLLPSLHSADVITLEQAAEGWIGLFDGETLYGWQATGDANWRVEDGEIRVDDGKEGWLMSTSEFADYELHVEFKAPPTTNSGVFLRTLLEPKDPTRDCYEVNIAPAANPFPTSRVVGRKGKQSLHLPMVFPKVSNRAPIDPWDGQWHSFDIKVYGDDVIVRLDGMGAAHIEEGAPPIGCIGLQFKDGAVSFRNIRLKPLIMNRLFNGRDLTGWNTKRADKSEFTVTDSGEIAVKNGPGQLETNDTFGDFIMQLDCKVNGEGLNSGIFFRCIPGDVLMGYESQIQNAMKDGDPTQPVDAGTGAIYRRTTARRIVAKDHEWFTKTIIANGPHIAVWVNGVQVTDWIDDRAPDENPRRGLRTKPGTIAIQGHDPTTDLLFRNLEIADLPKR